jgi:hypothetical protein
MEEALKRFLAVAVVVTTLAGGGVLLAASPGGAELITPSYDCSTDPNLVTINDVAIPMDVDDIRDPVGVGGTVTYDVNLSLPPVGAQAAAIDINTLTVTIPRPAGLDDVDVQLSGSPNPGLSFWTENVTADEVSVTYTNQGPTQKIRLQTSGVFTFPQASSNPVVVPDVTFTAMPGAGLENDTIVWTIPDITAQLQFFASTYELTCLPDSPETALVDTDVCGAQTFSDVAPSNTFFCDIDWMNVEEITTGFSGGIFKPNDAVKRQSMSAFMYRLAGSPVFVDPVTPTFADVAPSSTFYTEIEWMAAEEITTGTNGLFKPNDTVKRAAMSAFMYRFAEEPAFVDPVTPSFSDVGTGHQFYTEIEWMAAEGITTGFPGNLFKPTQVVTRQSMSAFMHRLDTLLNVDP